MKQSTSLPEELIMHKIHLIRGQKVMFDRDLAILYGVPTKALKQSVNRNLARFPEDFMFELTENEYSILRSQIVTSKKGGTRYMPYVFTEMGVAMLSTILNSEKAIEEIRKKTENNTKNIELVFKYLDELLDKKEHGPSPNKIGYKT